MIERISKENSGLFLMVVGLVSWLVPGAGYFLLGQKKRAVIIFVTIVFTFCLGLYVGSIGVIDPVSYKLWYLIQIMTSPFVAVLGHISAGGAFPVFGKPCEIGQIYTSVAGFLNLLCVVNSVYAAYLCLEKTDGG